MPRTLVCNLDPQWDFEALCTRHGLDLFRDHEIEVWNVRDGAQGENPLHWPTNLRRQELLRRLEEFMDSACDPPSQVVMLCGLQSAPDWKTVSELCLRLQEKAKRFLVSSTRWPSPDALPFDGVLLTEEKEPSIQHSLFRLLLEILREKPELLFPENLASKTMLVRLQTARETPVDRVVVRWPQHAAWLHRRLEALLQSGNRGHALEIAEHRNGNFLDKALELSKQVGSPPDLLAKAKEPGSSAPKPPLFYCSGLPSEIRKTCDDFQESLRIFLRNAYREVESVRDTFRSELTTAGEALFNELKGVVIPAALGFGQDVVEWLEKKADCIKKDYFPEVQKSLKVNLKEMEAKDPSGPPGKKRASNHPELIMPRFPEDDVVEEKRDLACRAAARLASLRWFLAVLGCSLLLATLPLWARRKGGGTWPFAEWLDPVWAGLFVGVFTLSMTIVAFWRKRLLRKALLEFETSMRMAIEKHKRALAAIFAYLRARAAQKRLEQLVQHYQTYLKGIKPEVAASLNLMTFLRLQLDYYGRQGHLRDHDSALEGVELSAFPSQWITDVLAKLQQAWSADIGVDIEIDHDQLMGEARSFKIAYFTKHPVSLTLKALNGG